MSKKRFALLMGSIAMAFLLLISTIAYAQTSSFTVGAFTIDATDTPAVTVKPPVRAGTLAVTADIPPALNIIAGGAVLNNGTVTVNFPAQNNAPVCVATDITAVSAVRRTAVTVSSVSFEGVTNHAIEYICAARNN